MELDFLLPNYRPIMLCSTIGVTFKWPKAIRVHNSNSAVIMTFKGISVASSSSRSTPTQRSCSRNTWRQSPLARSRDGTKFRNGSSRVKDRLSWIGHHRRTRPTRSDRLSVTDIRSRSISLECILKMIFL